ncbi:MAG: GNAT family N-acetyltransferase [Chitinophagaceae bacterium]|nr:GNAT family N-acetyltransferase [Chitinophagaceae bacterium]MCW5928721.1 GNAT family N-acetyltransferase [Chitinophagaceae bacterium]
MPELSMLDAGDLDPFIELIQVFNRVFETGADKIPPDDYLRSLLAAKQFRVIVAKLDGKVVGGLTIYLLDQYYVARQLAYIYDVAVLPGNQRQGIGKLLIGKAKEYLKAEGVTEMYVQAENADAHALEFYAKTGIKKATSTTSFDYEC